MKCCVIGGTGFIGSHLIQALLETGRDVLVIGRKEKNRVNLPGGVAYLQGDVSDAEFIENALEGVGEIIDLAYSSVPKTSFEDPLNDILSNLPSSVALFNAATHFPIKKIIYVSSGGTVYGEPLFLPITEDHPTNPISPYGITKLALEKYAKMYFRIKGLPIVSVRPSNPYGEMQIGFVGQGFVATAMASVLMQKEIRIFGENGTVRDYIYVGDLARAIVAALEYGSPGECYNVGTSIGRSNLEVIEEIAVLAKKNAIEPRISFMPHRPFDVSANILDAEKLHSVSGWHPLMGFREGIERTWEWYVSQQASGQY